MNVTARTKRKPGPRLEVHDPVAPVTYNVDEMTRRRLKVLGDGNESKGVREAARIAYEWWQRQP